jgi:hypothetical protein
VLTEIRQPFFHLMPNCTEHPSQEIDRA